MPSTNSLPKVLVTRKIPESGLELLRKHFIVEMNEKDRDLTQSELLRGLKGKFGVVSMLNNKFDSRLISELAGLMVISNFAVGFNNVDVRAATENGIVVTNTPGVLTDATADQTFGLLIAAARRIAEGDRLVRAGRFRGWYPLMMLGQDVSGKTIGIIGAGRIGTAVAARAAGFGMKILYFSRGRNDRMRKLGARAVSLEKLLSQSDFVSVNVPLTRETDGMIGGREIRLMKSNAILINTARGEVVDESALIQALKSRKIAGAGLDVYTNEPNVRKDYFKLDNVVLAPHLGSATFGTRSKMAELAAMNLISVLKGTRPPSVVNPEVL